MKDLKRNHDQSSKFSDLQQIGSEKKKCAQKKKNGEMENSETQQN